MGEEVVNDGGDKLSAEEWNAKFNEGGWVNTLSEDTLKNPGIQKFSKGPVENVLKSYFELQKGFGDKVPKPRVSFKKEEWDSWNKEHNEGYPKNPDEYNLELKGVEVPDNFKLTGGKEEAEKTYKQWAHELGLTKSQAERLWQKSKVNQIEHFKAIEAKQQESMNGLKKDWGSKYDDNMKIVRGVLTEFGDEEIMKEISSSANPGKIFKMISKIGENFKEGKLEIGGTPSGQPSPAEISIQISDLMRKPAYLNDRDPAHDAIVKQVNDLFRAKEAAKG